MKGLYLIGYRGLRHDKFFSLLEDEKVQVLLDVRRNPYSPNPDYQKNAIEEAASITSVKYKWAPALGVPGAGKSEIEEGAPGTFAEQMASKDGQRALQKLLHLLSNDVSVALMCSEPNYRDCHRSALVSMVSDQLPSLPIHELTAVGEQRLF